MALFAACLKPTPEPVAPKLPVETADSCAQADLGSPKAATPLAVALLRGHGAMGTHRPIGQPQPLLTDANGVRLVNSARAGEAKHSRWGSGLFSSARLGSRSHHDSPKVHQQEAAPAQPTAEADSISLPSTAVHSRRSSIQSRRETAEHSRRSSFLHFRKNSDHSVGKDSVGKDHSRKSSGFLSLIGKTRVLSRFSTAAKKEQQPAPADDDSYPESSNALVTYQPSPEFRYAVRGATTRLLESMSPTLMRAVQQTPVLSNLAYRTEEVPAPLGHRASMRAAALRRAVESHGYLAPTSAQLHRQRAMAEAGYPASGSLTARSSYSAAPSHATYRSTAGNLTARSGAYTARGMPMHDVPFHEAHKLLSSRQLRVEGKPNWR